MQDEHLELREWFFENYTKYTTEENFFPIEANINMDIFWQIDYLKQKIISEQKNNNPAKAEDQFLRRCPYCNLIWTKVEGCDSGMTTCGSVPKAKDQGGWKG
jgi:hypothetical protein